MRTRAKFVHEILNFSLKNLKRLEVKFDPLHQNAGNVREFYHGATTKKFPKTNPECVTKASVVCDRSDPLVTVHFQNNHKLVINSKYLESGHIVRIINQFSQIHKDDPEEL